MSSSGPNSPATGANIAYSGFAWTNPGNVVASDNSYATRYVSGYTDYLRATDFGFAIPSGATINGIVVEVERKSSAGYSITDYVNPGSCKLIKGGSAVGASKADGGTWWPTSDAYKSYGGASDLWDTTWTDTEINDSGFGFQISCYSFSKSTPTASIDHIRITVYYTEGVGGGGISIPVVMHHLRQQGIS